MLLLWSSYLPYEIVTGLLYLRGSSGYHRLRWYGRNSSARKACVARYARIYIVPCRRVRQWPNQYFRVWRVIRTVCRPGARTDFNEVIHCVKTKLDNFIAMALARSTSIIFHYVNFPSPPFVPPTSFQRYWPSRRVYQTSAEVMPRGVAKFRVVRINVSSVRCERASICKSSYGANRFVRILDRALFAGEWKRAKGGGGREGGEIKKLRTRKCNKLLSWNFCSVWKCGRSLCFHIVNIRVYETLIFWKIYSWNLRFIKY